MSRSFKSAKTAVKETYSLSDSLSETIRNDFKKNLSGLDEAITQRMNEAEKAILESSKAREAMVAGIGSMKKVVEKAQRKFSKTNNLEELRTTLIRVLVIILVTFVLAYGFGEYISEFLLSPLRSVLSDSGKGQIVYLGLLDNALHSSDII